MVVRWIPNCFQCKFRLLPQRPFAKTILLLHMARQPPTQWERARRHDDMPVILPMHDWVRGAMRLPESRNCACNVCSVSCTNRAPIKDTVDDDDDDILDLEDH